MNTETQLSSISPKTAFRAAALAALFALASAVAVADQPPDRIASTRAAKVSLAGLDLSTPEGARTAYKRIKATAERLCFQMGDPSLIDNQALYNDCVLKTFADTVRRISSPALVALDKKRTEP
ncbi:MAG: UrcA family protein [Steroidobacteraceae bacterium]|jgi:UrcA family protein